LLLVFLPCFLYDRLNFLFTDVTFSFKNQLRIPLEGEMDKLTSKMTPNGPYFLLF
jgi:hypothetical protein